MGNKPLKLRLLAALTALCLGYVAGCSDPYTMYQVPGSYVAEGQKILILPFMDTRTYQSKDDPHRYDLGIYVRNLFAEVLRQHPQASGNTILIPHIQAPTKSLTNAEVAELGRQHGADIVISGQVFSFTDTRAASIPARAGMFIRVISAKTGALLFVGDHYQAATVPVAGGNRDQQAKIVSTRLVDGIMAHAGQAVSRAAEIASDAALAMLPASPVKIRLRFANKGGDRKKSGNNDTADSGHDAFPGFTAGSQQTTADWDAQLVPEVPPVLDYGDDFYALPAPPLPGAEAAPAPAEGETARETAASDSKQPEQPAVEAPPSQENDTATTNETPAPLPSPTPGPAVTTAAAEPSSQPEQTSEPAPAADETAVAADAATAQAIPAPVPEATPEPAPVAAATPEPTSPVMVAAPIVAMNAGMIDELPELEMGRVASTMASVDARAAIVSQVASLSGDQLAADLFESDGEIFQDVPAASATVAPAPVANTPATDSSAMAMALTPDDIRPVPDAAFSPLEIDPDTLTVRRSQPAPTQPAARTTAATGPRTPAYAPLPGPITNARLREIGVPAHPPGTAEVAATATVNDGDGPFYSEPMAVEQPRTYKLVDLSEDPAAVRQDDAPEISAPRKSGDDNAIRVLLLPYHDRDNENNLIANTGGGEVVTTLYGTQLALDPGLRVMWDATGMATHNRLLSIDEALELAQLAGADYVMRGQVVEFRRAQSVPSFYSAVISTAVLAAQVFFAEMSGVDVATEVYRVRDGECIMSRRDRAQQKYVVQAEKTVRRLAIGMADSVSRALRDPNPETMDPLIDEVEPVTVMTNPR